MPILLAQVRVRAWSIISFEAPRGRVGTVRTTYAAIASELVLLLPDLVMVLISLDRLENAICSLS